MITNGWSYVFLGIGTFYNIEWMVAAAGVYLAFLWMPFTAEKVLTVIIAMALLRLLFPKDEHTLGVLSEMYNKFKKRGKKQEKI